MINIDTAIAKFEEYRLFIDKFESEDLNESDTRSKIIDTLLLNVLGWEETDIRREGYSDSGYFDYKISIPGIHFIIEAKKQFIEFKFPSNHKKTTTKALLSGNQDVIKQIREYSLDAGIPYGIITNGRQFIFIKTFNSDGIDWKSNDCLIFHSLDDVKKRFIEFYNNLSKNSLISNGGFKYDLPISTIENKTILSSIIDRDSELIRNTVSADITPLIETIFGEIFSGETEDDEEFINECFVENEETKKNRNEIERKFGDYAPQIKNIIPIVNSENLSNHIISTIKKDNVFNKNTSPPNPIIIIGSKGAGKTTFINHLFKYKLDSSEIENYFLVYIDFRNFFETNTNIEDEKLAEEIINKIYLKYENLELYNIKVLERIYKVEIKRNDESTWKYDKENDVNSYQHRLSDFLENAQKNSLKHLEHLSKYLIKERRKRLIIIIDNADQLNDLVQERLFKFSHTLSMSTLSGTVLSLREGYYYKWQYSPPFDAYISNIYHITAPNYEEILQKRINYAIMKAPNFEQSINGTNFNGHRYNFPPHFFINFLSELDYSIYNDKNMDIIDFLNHTTYPNIREGLRVFKSFLTSGHTKLVDYMMQAGFNNQDKKLRLIPFHEFFKSIALQNRHYYSSERSIIYNLFIPPVDSNDHFLKIYILKELNNFIEQKISQKLIPNTFIVEKLNKLGYKVNTINSAIASLLKPALIETDEQLSDVRWEELPSTFNMCLTAKGHFYLINLLDRFHYLELTLQDTPIYDIEHFNKILTKFPRSNNDGSRSLAGRIECVKLFTTYLKNSEKNQPAQILTVYGEMMSSFEIKIENEIGNIKKYAFGS